MASAFLTGLFDGMGIARYAFDPPLVSTEIPPEVLEPTYRPADEDQKNIQRYFDKAIAHAEEEVSARTKTDR